MKKLDFVVFIKLLVQCDGFDGLDGAVLRRRLKQLLIGSLASDRLLLRILLHRHCILILGKCQAEVLPFILGH